MYAIYFAILLSPIRAKFRQIDSLWLTEILDADQIHKMCLELYLCREFRILEMEDHIFQKLTFILRSTEVVVAITRDRRYTYDDRFILD